MEKLLLITAVFVVAFF